MDPLSLNRLAVRIEQLQQLSTHGWDNADSYELRMFLPGGRIPQCLPDPMGLRADATYLQMGETPRITVEQYRQAIQRCLRLEGLAHDNRSNNPKRLMRDMAHGRVPNFRR